MAFFGVQSVHVSVLVCFVVVVCMCVCVFALFSPHACAVLCALMACACASVRQTPAVKKDIEPLITLLAGYAADRIAATG